MEFETKRNDIENNNKENKHSHEIKKIISNHDDEDIFEE